VKEYIAVREMIFQLTLKDEEKHSKNSSYQRKDFEGIFKVMAGKPVTIRTLDPPYMNSYLMKKKK
jgi:pyruvate,orthophosphate dikinase